MKEGQKEKVLCSWWLQNFFFFLPHSLIQKRKLLQQYLICSLLIVSAMLRRPLNFERLGNAGLESYFLLGRTVNSKSAEKCCFSESNESQALPWLRKKWSPALGAHSSGSLWKWAARLFVSQVLMHEELSP